MSGRRGPIDVHIRPGGPTLEAFLVSDARAKFLQGPVGSAKTTTVIDSLMLNAIHRQTPANGQMGTVRGARHRRTLVLRSTYKQLVDTVIPSLRMRMPEDVWGPISVSGRPRRLVKMPGLVWEWLFYAADKAEDVEDLKSLEISDAWASEYRYLPREVMATLVERTGRYPPVAAGGCVCPQVMGETNAPTEGHWSAVMSGQTPIPEGLAEADKKALVRPENWHFFIQPPAVLEVRGDGGRVVGYEPNPAAENLANLPPDYYRNALAGRTEQEIRTELLNKPGQIRVGKPVWAGYREEVHKAGSVLEPIAGHPVIVGQDFGRTPATVFCQAVFGRWYVLAELWAENTGARAYADVLGGFMGSNFPGFNFVMYGDPAGEHLAEAADISPMLMFRAAGLKILPAPSNDPTIRVNAVDQLLRRMVDGAPGLLVSPRCRLLLAALGGGYQYRRLSVAGEVYSDAPEKNRFSHVADALQYAVIGGGEGRALVTKIGPEHSLHRHGVVPRRPAGAVIPFMGRGRGWQGIGRR